MLILFFPGVSRQYMVKGYEEEVLTFPGCIFEIRDVGKVEETKAYYAVHVGFIKDNWRLYIQPESIMYQRLTSLIMSLQNTDMISVGKTLVLGLKEPVTVEEARRLIKPDITQILVYLNGKLLHLNYGNGFNFTYKFTDDKLGDLIITTLNESDRYEFFQRYLDGLTIGNIYCNGKIYSSPYIFQLQ